jgi:hypothetical protein
MLGSAMTNISFLVISRANSAFDLLKPMSVKRSK